MLGILRYNNSLLADSEQNKTDPVEAENGEDETEVDPQYTDSAAALSHDKGVGKMKSKNTIPTTTY